VEGEPSVAGIIVSFSEDGVKVIFPYSQYGCNEYVFKYNNIRPYTTQFPGGRFQPLNIKSTMDKDSQSRTLLDM